ncbi:MULTISPECIES: hypothetical protein [unclassified Methanosarcina]|nr:MULTISPECIES: hypothetical protein [unclassified Methanosarcina]
MKMKIRFQRYEEIAEKDKTDSEKAKNYRVEKAGERGTSGLKLLQDA